MILTLFARFIGFSIGSICESELSNGGLIGGLDFPRALHLRTDAAEQSVGVSDDRAEFWSVQFLCHVCALLFLMLVLLRRLADSTFSWLFCAFGP